MTPLEAALNYANRGWTVLPVHSIRDGRCSCGKQCESPGKHPRTRNGVKDATTDPAVIRSWWNVWPDANVAIATGTASGLWALDVDAGGDISLDELEEENSKRPDTPEQHTGGGGFQVFFRADSHIPNKVRFAVGLDVRGDGGYVVAPPSSHISGGVYEWDAYLGPDTPLATAPQWLLDKILASTASTKPALRPVEVLDGVPAGKRNEALFRYACRLVNKGLTQAEIVRIVTNAARNAKPPLSDAETEKLIGSALRYQEPEEPPVPLAPSTELKPFPVAALRVADDILADFVEDIAEVRQVPPDLPGMIILTALATCTQRRVKVQIGGSHSVWTNLYAAVALPPGSRKSAVFRDIMAPLKTIEDNLVEKAKPGIIYAQNKHEADEGRLKAAQRRASKAKTDNERNMILAEIVTIQENMVEPPADPCLYVGGDSGLEILAKIIAEQGERISLFDDEGGVFSILAGLYNDGRANIDLVLKAWDGSGHRVRRMSRAPINLESPLMTVGLCVQPDVIESLADQGHFRGRGLLGRFAYSIPPSLVGTRLYQERGLRPDLAAAYDKLIRDTWTATDPDDVVRLDIEDAALEQWRIYHDQVEIMQREGGALESITDWGSKIAGIVAGIAGNLHIARYRSGDPAAKAIEVDTVLAAWAIGEYLIGHAIKAFGMMVGDPAMNLAKQIMEWIYVERLDSFSARDLQRRFRTISRQSEFVPALRILEDRGLVELTRDRSSTDRGGRPRGARYQVANNHGGFVRCSGQNLGFVREGN